MTALISTVFLFLFFPISILNQTVPKLEKVTWLELESNCVTALFSIFDDDDVVGPPPAWPVHKGKKIKWKGHVRAHVIVKREEIGLDYCSVVHHKGILKSPHHSDPKSYFQ